MSILDQIVADKKIEVAHRKSLFPVSYWEASPLFERKCISLSTRLKASRSGILAEHKRRSPSKPNIRLNGWKVFWRFTRRSGYSTSHYPASPIA
jgi:indole-3-glycerol phosphate synthase